MQHMESGETQEGANISHIEVFETSDGVKQLRYKTSTSDHDKEALLLNEAIQDVFNGKSDKMNIIHTFGGDTPEDEMWEFTHKVSQDDIEQLLPRVYDKARRNLGGNGAHA